MRTRPDDSAFYLTRDADLFRYLEGNLPHFWEFAMNLKKAASCVVAIFAIGIVPTKVFAQPGSFGGGFGPALKVVPPPKVFSTSDEHYKYLLDQAKGGTKHTVASV